MQKMKSKERISQEFVSKLEGVEVNYLTLFSLQYICNISKQLCPYHSIYGHIIIV